MLGCMKVIREKHTSYLARPKHVEKKWVFEDECVKCRYAKIKHPVVPIKNKRLEMLAMQYPFKSTPKYEEPEVSSTVVPRSTLETVCTPRLDHLSRPLVRILVASRNERRALGKNFIDIMNDRIATSLDTIYYHNIKSLKNIETNKKKPPPKRPKYFEEVGDKERLVILAKSKKKHKPPSKPRRKKMKLELLKPRIDRLAMPLQVYKRPSQDSLLRRLKVSPAAMKYEATERMKELAKLPKHRLFVRPVQTGWVSPGALTYEITDRMKVLATPAARACAPEMDLKENPYDINPFALKYKATPRIIQLAKPIDR